MMGRRRFGWGSLIVVAITALSGCGKDEPGPTESATGGSAGTTSSGGSPGAGAPSSGGATGGAVGAAGAPSEGGAAGVAGAPSSGGAGGLAGAPSSGGAVGGAGAPNGGGAAGVPGGGGAAGAAVSPVTWSRVGSGDGFDGEDPTVLIVGDAPALGYAFIDSGPEWYPHLHFWTDGAWGASVGEPTPAETTGSSYRSTAFCSDGTSVFIAHELPGDGAAEGNEFYDRTFVFRFEDDAWDTWGGGDQVSLPADSGQSSDEPGIACAAGTDPVVSWTQLVENTDEDADSGWAATVSESGFTRTGPLESVVDATYLTSVRITTPVVDSDGAAFVAAWEDNGDGGQVLRVYDLSAAGAPLGPAVATDLTDSAPREPAEPALLLDDGAPVVAWEAALDDSGERDIYAAQWTGSEWESLGTGPIRAYPDTHFDARDPALVLADGVPTLAWAEQEEGGAMSIFVARFDGTDWVLVGDALNIDPDRDTEDPSIAYGDGTLYVAFEEFVDGARQIFVQAAAP